MKRIADQLADQHPDDAAVDRFAAAMKAKLKKKRQGGRAGWQFMASEQLSAMLREHVRKGDPVDVANLAMMLHQNEQVIEPPAAAVTDEMVEILRAEGEQRDEAQKAVSWARPVYATEPTEGWEADDLVDIEFYNRPEKPEGEGWRPLVFADTDGATLRERLGEGAEP